MGDGGMVVTNNPDVYERVEMLRRHGGKVKYHHSELGLNSRLDELQAAILRVKLRHLDLWNDYRRQNAYRYNRMLAGTAGLTCPAEHGSDGTFIPTGEDQPQNNLLRCVYHQYTLLADNRDDVVAVLKDLDIGCLVYYPVPLHFQEVHVNLDCRPGRFPVAEQVARCCFSIPMFPELTEEQQSVVAAVLKRTVADGEDGRSVYAAA